MVAPRPQKPANQRIRYAAIPNAVSRPAPLTLRGAPTKGPPTSSRPCPHVQLDIYRSIRHQGRGCPHSDTFWSLPSVYPDPFLRRQEDHSLLWASPNITTSCTLYTALHAVQIQPIHHTYFTTIAPQTYREEHERKHRQAYHRSG